MKKVYITDIENLKTIYYGVPHTQLYCGGELVAYPLLKSYVTDSEFICIKYSTYKKATCIVNITSLYFYTNPIAIG